MTPRISLTGPQTGTLLDVPGDLFDDLSRQWQRLEELVDTTPGIDPWCSGPDWVLPAYQAFAPTQDLLLVWGDDSAIILDRHREEGRTILAGLEALWGFASPLLGPDLPRVAGALAERLGDDRDWDFLVLSGLPLSPDLATSLADRLSSLGKVRAHYGIVRLVADLGEGVDVWFSRRSARFRQALRRSERLAAAAGLEFVDVSQDDDAFHRCVDIERRSWKGQDDSGIVGDEMYAFYDEMTIRLRERNRFRAMVARLGNEDVGFIFGGIRAGRYRGLQLSQVERVRPLAVGHLLQLQTIRALAADDEPVEQYDLGMDMDYKRRWSDHEEPSMTLVVERTRQGARRWIG